MRKRNIAFGAIGLLFAIVACIGGGGGGGGGSTNIKTCLEIKINICSSDGVKGMVTNNCSSDITIAEIQTVGYDSSGNVVDQDPEYVENIEPTGRAYFESLFYDPGYQIARCSAEVTNGY